MKAMTLKTYGETAEFEETEIPRPDADAGHVIVRVSATSVNTVDTMIRNMGQDELPFAPDLPAILGTDFAGTVESVGDGVTEYKVGDEVYGCAGGLGDLQGALAEFMPADVRLISHKPKSLSMREAAALPLVAITAFEGLKRAGIGGAQKVLVHGGTGGVGHVAVQLAKHFGAEVYTTIGNDDETSIVENFGARAINYKAESVEDYVSKHTDGKGFDIVFDSVGGENLAKSFEAAALNGQIATTVSMLEMDLTPVHFKGLSLHVVFMLIPMIHDFRRSDHGAILSELRDIADAGALRPLLDETEFGLKDVGKAYSRLSSGKATGKVVISL